MERAEHNRRGSFRSSEISEVKQMHQIGRIDRMRAEIDVETRKKEEFVFKF